MAHSLTKPSRRRGVGRPKAVYSQAARLLMLYRRLSAVTAVTYEDLATEFAVSTRTVRRDMVALSEANVPVEETTDSDTGAKLVGLMPKAREGVLRLTQTQTMALLLASGLFEDFRGTFLWEQLDEVNQQLLIGLTEKLRADLPRLRNKLFVIPDAPKSYEGSKSDIVDEILSALLHDNKLEIEYRSAQGRKSRFVLHPYTLAVWRHGLYLVGHSETRGESMRLPVERIEKCLRRRGEHFEYPPGYDSHDQFAGSFGIHRGDTPERIVIEFDGGVASYIRSRQWHPTQKFEKTAGGKILFKMTAPVSPEVVSWVLSWGDKARVLRPAGLVESVAAELRRAAGFYR